MEPRHCYYLAALVIAVALIATMFAYDIGGVFSAPPLN